VKHSQKKPQKVWNSQKSSKKLKTVPQTHQKCPKTPKSVKHSQKPHKKSQIWSKVSKNSKNSYKQTKLSLTLWYTTLTGIFLQYFTKKKLNFPINSVNTILYPSLYSNHCYTQCLHLCIQTFALANKLTHTRHMYYMWEQFFGWPFLVGTPTHYALNCTNMVTVKWNEWIWSS